jgi:ATP-binding cassette subfamily C protein
VIPVIQKVFSFLDTRTRVQGGGLLVLMAVSALLEMLSIALVFPLVQLIFAAGEGPAWAEAARRIVGVEGFALAVTACAIFVLVFVGKNAALLAIQYAISRFTLIKLAAFQNRLYRHYLERPYVAQLADHSALPLRNIATASTAVFDALRALMTLALEGMLIAAAVVTLAVLVPGLALAGVVLFLILAGAFHFAAGPYFRRLGEAANAANAGLLRWTIQGIAALKDIKAFDCAPYFESRFTAQTRELVRVRTWRQVSQLAPRALVETLIIVACAGAIIFLYADRAQAGEVFGALGVAGLAAMRVVPSTNRVLGLIAELHQFGAEVGALYDELGRHPAADTPGGDCRPADSLPFTREIRLEGIAFRYDDDRAPALSDLSLTIRKGEAVGIIGPSGAGKSTLVDLLLGLLTPDRGRLLVDGADAFAAIRAWRANIGYVPQSIYLLDDTIRRNVAFGVPDEAIDPARLERALRLAQLNAFVAGLPEGTETRVGEGGARLSGGQRQRIGIARALYRDPPILLFDEATSALDAETEREIVAAIDSLKGGRTLIIVAHRLTTLAGCDRIVMLAGGRVADDAAYADMARRHPDLNRAREASTAGR